MLRKIFLVLILAAFAALSVFFFYQFNQKKEIRKDHFTPIPTNSVWVAEVKQPGDFLSTLKGTNIIYDELSQAGLIDSWRIPLEKLDSILDESAVPNELPEDFSILFALVPEGAGKYDLLMTVQLNEWLNEKKSLQLLAEVLGPSNRSKNYDGAEVIVYQSSNQQIFSTHYSGFLLLSTGEMVLEDAIRQSNSDHGLMNDESFKKVMATAGNSRRLNWYVNQENLAGYLNQNLETDYGNALKQGMGLTGWSELDLWLKPNSMMFNGYSSNASDKKTFMSCFKDQSPGTLGITSVLPINTALFAHFSLSNYANYRKNYGEYLESREQLSSYIRDLKVLDDSAGVKTGELLEKHIGSEVGLAILEVQNDVKKESISAIRDKAICLVRVKDEEKWIDDIVPLIKANESEDLFKLKYREVEIFELNVTGLISNHVGGPFKGLENRYFALLDEYVVFAEKLPTLREVINAWRGGKVLDEYEHYSAFGDNLSSTANVTLYTSIARSPYLYSYFLKNDISQWISENLELFRRFEGLAIQVSHEKNDLLYYNAFIKHNPIYKKVTSSLWEIPLDTTVSSAPQLFINHYTKAGEILIQDDANRLYLVSNTGRVLWSRQIDGRALSSYYQVDKYKNNKFQILFNTQNKIYLLDRNGKDVEGFPIKLKENASGPISVMDYDRNRKYRLLQPTINGAIKCFDINGKTVSGWKFKGKTPVKELVRHVSLRKKDYIIIIDQKQRVRIVNRKGQDRLTISEPLHRGANSEVSLLTGKDLGSTYLVTSDSSGNIIKLSLADKLETMQFSSFEADHFYNTVDLNADGNLDHVYQTGEELVVYDNEGKTILNLEPSFGLNDKPYFFTSYDKVYCSLANSKGESISLFDHFGSEVEGGPFLGTGKPLIYDINLDDRLEFVSISTSGMVYCYVLN